MDDVVVMARNKKEAIQKLQQIREFLTTNLKLELNSKTSLIFQLMSSGHILQISLRIAIQNQIGIAQWIIVDEVV